MQNTAENLPLTEKEIEETRKYLHEQLLPVSDPAKSMPLEEVEAEIRKHAKL